MGLGRGIAFLSILLGNSYFHFNTGVLRKHFGRLFSNYLLEANACYSASTLYMIVRPFGNLLRNQPIPCRARLYLKHGILSFLSGVRSIIFRLYHICLQYQLQTNHELEVERRWYTANWLFKSSVVRGRVYIQYTSGSSFSNIRL